MWSIETKEVKKVKEIKKEESLEGRKEDGKEFLELLRKIPPERHDRILGLIEGIAIQAENEQKAG